MCKSVIVCLLEIANYCISAAPTLLYANSPAPVPTVYDLTNFTCNLGYSSSDIATAPYYTCLPLNALTGQWSSIVYTCDGTDSNKI